VMHDNKKFIWAMIQIEVVTIHWIYVYHGSIHGTYVVKNNCRVCPTPSTTRITYSVTLNLDQKNMKYYIVTCTQITPSQTYVNKMDPYCIVQSLDQNSPKQEVQ